MTAVLYSLMVLIWGSTWIAIRTQAGVAPVEVSILWRFLIAASVLFAALLAGRRLRLLRPIDHLVCLAQGATLFSFNFVSIYHASAHVTSGVIAVVFSTASLWSAALARLALGERRGARPLAGGVLGLAGLLLLFWPEWTRLGPEAAPGLGLALLGTATFSCGALLSVVHQRNGVPPLVGVAWGMAYGVLLLSIIILWRGLSWRFDPSTSYLLALLYLAIPGSVIGFWIYITLVHRLGAGAAAYTTVLFPLVALSISTVFEDYRWTAAGLAGVALVLGGNVMAFLEPRRTTG